MNSDDKDMDITLPLLQTIEEQHDISQRRLAERLGVALGLANNFIKNCVKKGLIKVEQTPANRYFYYLTPQGLAEKSRLTTRYLSNQFKFYRDASEACRDCFTLCRKNNWQKVVLAGAGELAEIAMVQAVHEQIEVIGLFDPVLAQKEFLGIKVINTPDKIPKAVVILITALDKEKQLQMQLMKNLEKIEILTPKII